MKSKSNRFRPYPISFIILDYQIHPTLNCLLLLQKNKRQMSPITDPRCPEGSRKLSFPDYMTMALDGGKVVSLRHRPLLPPGNTPDTHSC